MLYYDTSALFLYTHGSQLSFLLHIPVDTKWDTHKYLSNSHNNERSSV